MVKLKIALLTIAVCWVLLLPVISRSQKPELVVQAGHTGAVYSSLFSADGELIASMGTDAIIIWQTSSGIELRRIYGSFAAFDLSPDSKVIAAVEKADTDFRPGVSNKISISIQLFNIDDGRQIRRFGPFTDKINSVKFSRDGSLLLIAGDDNAAKLLNASDGRVVRVFTGHTTPVRKAIFSPDERYIATVGGEYDEESESAKDSTARIWETATGNEIRKLEHKDANDRFNGIGDVAFSSGGNLLITSAQPAPDRNDTDKAIRVWDLSNGRSKKTFEGFGPIFSSGKYLIADLPGEPRGVEIIDIDDGRTAARIDEFDPDSILSTAAISPDGKYVAAGVEMDVSGGSTTYEFGKTGFALFETSTGKKVRNLEGKGVIRGFNSEGWSFIRPLAQRGMVLVGNYLWDLINGTQIDLEKADYRFSGQGGHYRAPLRVISSDGKFIAMSYEIPDKSDRYEIESGMQIWNTETGQLVRDFKNKGGFSARFTPDNSYLAIEAQNNVTLLEVSSGKTLWSRELDHFYNNILTKRLGQDNGFTALSPDGKTMIIREAKSLSLIDTITGKTIWTRKNRSAENLPGTHISPDGSKYIVAVQGGTEDEPEEYFVIFDIKTHKEIFRARSELFPANLSDTLFAANDLKDFGGRNVLVYKNTGRTRATLPANPDYGPWGWHYRDANAFSTDAGLFIATTNKGLVLYDLRSGKKLRDIAANDLRDAAFILDDKYILGSSLNGKSVVWETATGREVCRLFSFSDGTWVVTTSDGRFDTNNLERTDYLHWVLPGGLMNPLPVDIFMRDYYEPKLLARVFENEKFRPIRDLSALNRTQPEIKITGVKTGTVSDIAEVTVEVKNAPSLYQKDANGKALESGAYDMRVFRDGQLVGYSTVAEKLESTFRTYNDPIEELTAWRKVHQIDLNNGKAIFKFNVKIPADARGKQVEFSAYAFNHDRVKSESARAVYSVPTTQRPVTKRAYVITMGVNKYDDPGWNLMFAGNDARAMNNMVLAKLRAGKDFSEVVGIPLVSDDETVNAKTVKKRNATKANLRSVFDILAGRTPDPQRLKVLENALGAENLKKIRAATPDDFVLISFSSHGYADRSGIFYILPSDIIKSTGKAVTDELLRHAVSSDELSLWLRDIDTGEMLMIVDACYASTAVEGRDFKPAPMGSRGLGQLAFDKGMQILTATQAANVAVESASIGHGLLSYALLSDGLGKSRADFRAKDNEILLKEWLQFGEYRVPFLYEDLAKGKLRSVGIRAGIYGGRNKAPAFQKPSLFDFRKKKTKIVLSVPGR